MKKKIEASKGMVIIYCLNAVVWIANLVLDLIEQETDAKSLLLKMVCAVLWSFAALLSFLRYRKEKKNTVE